MINKDGKYERIDWVYDYIKKNGDVDIVNEKFVKLYINEFNPKYNIMPFGANRCLELNRLLSEMYRRSYLKRSIISLHKMETGFPKWVYCYGLYRVKERGSGE